MVPASFAHGDHALLNNDSKMKARSQRDVKSFLHRLLLVKAFNDYFLLLLLLSRSSVR